MSSICPLCGEANACGMAAEAAGCWCFEVTIPREVLAGVPAEAQGVACVCQRCASGKKKTAGAASVEQMSQLLRKR